MQCRRRITRTPWFWLAGANSGKQWRCSSSCALTQNHTQSESTDHSSSHLSKSQLIQFWVGFNSAMYMSTTLSYLVPPTNTATSTSNQKATTRRWFAAVVGVMIAMLHRFSCWCCDVDLVWIQYHRTILIEFRMRLLQLQLDSKAYHLTSPKQKLKQMLVFADNTSLEF